MKIKNYENLFISKLGKKRWKKWYNTALLTMAAIVVFCTVYALILPAVTMESDNSTLNCQLNVHKHTAECYGDNGDKDAVTCGRADFVIHTHNQNCYDAGGRLVCTLPEKAVHKHSSSCYDKKGRLICKKDEIEKHTHSDSCYDKNGALICGKLQVTEHIHGSGCFSSAEDASNSSQPQSGEEETSDTEEEPSLPTSSTEDCSEYGTIAPTAVSGDIKATEPTQATVEPTQPITEPVTEKVTKPTIQRSNKAQQNATEGIERAADDDWGYNPDGSIWWGTRSVQETALADIKENTPYIITGLYGNNTITDEVYTKDNYSYLKAIPMAGVTDYDQYQQWYFEQVTESGNEYYLYFLKTDENNNKTKLYLKFAGYGSVEWNNETQQLELTADKSQATAFAMQDASTSTSKLITLSKAVDGTDFYINSYFGDREASENKTTHWLGYPDGTGGSCLRVCRYTAQKANTAGRVKTDISTNSVINLFDYWIGDNRYDPDNNYTYSKINTKINNGHSLKFSMGKPGDDVPLNNWTGQDQLPRMGAVEKCLDENGYPKLTSDKTIIGDYEPQSLQYLFDPLVECEGKASYRNISGLLSLDEQRYYAFDCKNNMAEFVENGSSGYINIYDKPAKSKGFYPFNKAPQIMDAARDGKDVNHYFGMTITTRFMQRYEGYTDYKKNNKTTFHFSGDDDVWIFIDNVLVGDLGGIHDACKVDIDFTTGKIDIAVANKPSNNVSTTLWDCYNAANKTDATQWVTKTVNGNTNTIFADNTTHTLKFFYLERGNYDSNLELKYNMSEIPETAISKINQYGDAVPGAGFAVYAADTSYNMLSKRGGTIVDGASNMSTYDDNGNLLDKNGNIAAVALYTGITDSNGELLFVDKDGMPYTIEELQGMFGNNFIIREIKVPDGYRFVSKDTYIQVYEGENQKILRCDNTVQSGSRAATNLQITATDTIHLNKHRPYNGRTDISYYDPVKNETFGTMFAVVFKYVGPLNDQGEIEVDQKNDALWKPVYGSDEEGYYLVDTNDGKDIVKAAISAAKEAKAYGDVIFKEATSGKVMRLTMDNLLGHITTYYRMLPVDQKQYTRYTISYYWTDQPSLETATPENTYNVNADAATLDDGTFYSGFDRIFGAEIQIPNLVNKVFVQKMDKDSNFVNGAKFAIYKVKEENGAIKYECADGSYVSLETTTEHTEEPTEIDIDKETGVISKDGKLINPIKTDVTRKYDDGIHKGTAEFSNLSDGQYIIREVKPPPGYEINPAEIMVLVTEDTIYANAGTEDDGVTVGRGPGYVVSTLKQFASEGQINNTLSWIFAQMQISQESTSFADVGDKSKIKGYLTENNTSNTSTNVSDAARTYLQYSSNAREKAFNYIPNEERTAESGAQNPTGTRRLFTTSGWPYYEIHQDYSYGLAKARASGAEYEDWTHAELTNLYSRSTYIRVTDDHGYELPATGGCGTIIFRIGGGLLILISIVCGYKIKRKKES